LQDAGRCQVYDLPAASLTAKDIPVVVKVVGIDRQNRRRTGWITIDRNSNSQATERLAQRHHESRSQN
jgi:hypothetical protein